MGKKSRERVTGLTEEARAKAAQRRQIEEKEEERKREAEAWAAMFPRAHYKRARRVRYLNQLFKASLKDVQKAKQ